MAIPLVLTRPWVRVLRAIYHLSSAASSRRSEDFAGKQRNGLVIDQPSIVRGRREAVKVVLGRAIGELRPEVRLCVLTLVVNESVAQLARVPT
jgi:hypothetical protein